MKIIAEIGSSHIGTATLPKEVRCKSYTDLSKACIYSKLKNHQFVSTVPAFCSHVEFDGRNFLDDFDKNE